jgi:hypothetical protein
LFNRHDPISLKEARELFAMGKILRLDNQSGPEVLGSTLKVSSWL